MNEKMTNQSLRVRMGIDEKNYPMVSRIFKETLDAGLIKESNPDNTSKKLSSYIPIWA